MSSEALLHSVMQGTGLALAARASWSALPVPEGLTFADRVTLAELRELHPAWRVTSLAPVSVVDASPLLDSQPEDSLDYLLAFEGWSGGGAVQSPFAVAARLLRTGGSLILHEIEPTESLSEPGRICALSRFGRALAKAAEAQLEHFTLEAIMRGDGGLFAIFSRNLRALPRRGSLFECSGRVYVMDARELRHVSTPAVLAAVRVADQPIEALSPRTLARLKIGKPMLQGDVAAFHAQAGQAV